MCQIVSTGIQPFHNLGTIRKLKNDFSVHDPTKWIEYYITSGLSNIEKIVEKQAKESRYFYGDEVTMIDCFMLPQMGAARKFHIDLSSFELLLEREKNLYADHECFKTTTPEAIQRL
jgi:glutathione S-transferase